MVPINMWGMSHSVVFARYWSINPIQNLASDEPEKGCPDIAIDDRLERKQSGYGARSGKYMDRKGFPTSRTALNLWRIHIGKVRSYPCCVAN